MVMMRIKLLLVALMSALTLSAQNKTLTLEDLNFGGNNYHNMRPENRFHAWWGDICVKQDVDKCSSIALNSGKEQTLFTLDDVNALTENEKIHSLLYAQFPYPGKTLVLLKNSKYRMLIDWKAKKLVWKQTAADESNAEWNVASKCVAYVKDYNLYITDADNNTKQLTTDGSREIVYAQSVHRDEFGIYKGTFWSNDGQRLAFYRMDQSMVKDYPQVDLYHREAEYAPDKYPMAGETSHKVTVGVYDIKTGKTIYLKAGDPTDRYFTNIAWSPDNTTIYMIELNRDQNDAKLVSYDASTGALKGVLYEEKDDKYVEPLHPICFLPWNDSQFILQSQKDGFNHLYLMDTKGENIKQLTKGKWVVMDLLGFNTKTKSAIILSNSLNDIQCNTFAVNIKSGKMSLLDNGKGVHGTSYDTTGHRTTVLSASGIYAWDSYSEPNVPHNIDLVGTDGSFRTNYLKAKDPWTGYNVPEITCGTIKAADGVTNLYYRMVKPIGFDPNKKYPTIVYVYGGPHAHNVEASWHYYARGWEPYMASKGYLLFILDNRGSENRGKDFEQVTFRHLGQEEMKDQICGVNYLKTLPYVDSTRMGVHGWSFGGYMTISLMTNYPDVFKVGVAGGPVIDWKWYEVMYGERYMDTPQTNPEGYKQVSLLSKAGNLKGKLQIIIGYNDPTVVPQHALSFIDKCIEAGTQPDFFTYPGEGHNMMGHKSVHLHERITQYFEDYLK
jgi:dipeptidyl-peptidase-4